MNSSQGFPYFLLSLLVLAGCASNEIPPLATAGVTLEAAPRVGSPTPPINQPESSATKSPTVSQAASPTPTQTPDWTATPDVRPRPNAWRSWPVLPVISQHAIDIYWAGVAAGNNPHAFSVFGDCQSQPEVFMGIYATNRYYFGAGYEYLQDAVDHFEGSFGRQSAAVEDGMSVASIFSPIWATHPDCQGSESPLDCELRVNNPSIVIISLGTNWRAGADLTFEELLRDLVDELLARNVLPILVTKADNVEADNRLNEIMAEVAYEYDIPLWNFWRAVQHLPNGGLETESRGGLLYLIPDAWDVKSFTGLSALDAVLRAANGYQP